MSESPIKFVRNAEASNDIGSSGFEEWLSRARKCLYGSDCSEMVEDNDGASVECQLTVQLIPIGRLGWDTSYQIIRKHEYVLHNIRTLGCLFEHTSAILSSNKQSTEALRVGFHGLLSLFFPDLVDRLYSFQLFVSEMSCPHSPIPVDTSGGGSCNGGPRLSYHGICPVLVKRCLDFVAGRSTYRPCADIVLKRIEVCRRIQRHFDGRALQCREGTDGETPERFGSPVLSVYHYYEIESICHRQLAMLYDSIATIKLGASAQAKLHLHREGLATCHGLEVWPDL